MNKLYNIALTIAVFCLGWYLFPNAIIAPSFKDVLIAGLAFVLCSCIITNAISLIITPIIFAKALRFDFSFKTIAFMCISCIFVDIISLAIVSTVTNLSFATWGVYVIFLIALTLCETNVSTSTKNT